MVSVREFVAKHRSFTSRHLIELAAILIAVQAICSPKLGAQIANETPVAQQHFQLQPGQAIDFKNLPEDVLNCDECRRRLGLPPLPQPIIESKVETGKPLETRSIVNAMKVAQKPEEVTKTDPQVEAKKVEVATTTPTLKQLGKPEDESSAKRSTPDAHRMEGVLTSPATQRIEIEILKRQLQERDAHLKQFSDMQSKVEERIDQLVRMNEELAKKDAGRQAEIDRLQKSSEQALQSRELELSNLRADLASVRADANEKSKRLNDQLIEVESKKSKELAKLNSELIEAKQARIDAVANLRKEFAAAQESAAKEIVQSNAEQAKTVESQRTTIRKLEEQLANAEKVQREDAERLGKLREDLKAAFAERTKAVNELAKRSKKEKTDELQKSKSTESAKPSPAASQPKADDSAKVPAIVKPSEPAKTTTPTEQPAANPETNSIPIENEPPKKRRAF